MMEPVVAESRYTLTKELFSEGMRRIIDESLGKTARRGVLALLGAWLLLTAATLLLRQSPVYIAVEAVVLGLAALWLTVYLPRSRLRRAWKRLYEQTGGELTRTTLFYADRLTVLAAGREVTVEYAELDRALRTERLLILVARNKTGVLLPHDSFLQGSEEAVLEALSADQ